MSELPPEATTTDRTVVLTFDYEIYFARSGTAERCLIAPVDQLLRELDAVGASACFFVDATHMLRMREERGPPTTPRASASRSAGSSRQDTASSVTSIRSGWTPLGPGTALGSSRRTAAAFWRNSGKSALWT